MTKVIKFLFITAMVVWIAGFIIAFIWALIEGNDILSSFTAGIFWIGLLGDYILHGGIR